MEKKKFIGWLDNGSELLSQCKLMMKKSILWVMVFLILFATSPTPTYAVDPITAGIAAGVAVELLKNITTAILGEAGAQVKVAAKTDGPHPAQDFVFNEDNDICYPCWSEWDLDADTGILTAPNHGANAHMTWAELHFHWENGGWRPNAIAYNKKAWAGFASPKPDGAPDPGSKNVTLAVAVGVFGSQGFGVVKSFKKVDEEIREVPQSPIASVEAQGSLYFTAERFKLELIDVDRIRISPVNGPLFVDLFHTSFMLAPNPVLVFEPFAGVSEQIGAFTATAAQGIADDSSGLAIYDPNPATKVDLTVAGAALFLGTGEYDRYFSDPPFNEKGPYDLLREYFSDTSAVQVVAPTHAQEGYMPDVVFLEVAFGSETIIAPGISSELRDTIPPAQLDGTGKDGFVCPVVDLVGIVLAVQGTLEDAVDLAANTPGTEIAQIVSNLQPGEKFTLDLNFAQSSAGMVDRYETNVSLKAITILNPEPIPVNMTGSLTSTLETSLDSPGSGVEVKFEKLGGTGDFIFVESGGTSADVVTNDQGMASATVEGKSPGNVLVRAQAQGLTAYGIFLITP